MKDYKLYISTILNILNSATHRWEDEYYAAYKKNSGLLHLDEINDEDDDGNEVQSVNTKIIVKSSDPEKFVSSITKSAQKLLGKVFTYS